MIPSISLNPNFQRVQRSSLRGERKKYKVTFNPSTASGGQTLYIKVPRLDAGLSIIPNTMAMSFEFKNANTKSRFNNNLASCLPRKFQIKIGKDAVYDNSRENTFRLFRDKWWSSGYLSSRIENGIASEGVRKVMSEDDSATSGAKSNDVLNTEIAARYKRLRFPLGQIFNDHGVFSPNRLGFDVEYIIELASATDIMKAQSSQTVDGYTLENLQLEYDTIRNESLASQSLSSFSGKILSYDDVRLEIPHTIPKSETLTNLTFHMTRQSLKALILLFRYVDQIEDEEFIYPNIDKVECTINGKPNSVFSQGLDVSDLHQEAKEYFMHEDKLNAAGFLKDRFVVVLDFRSVRDHNVSNTGTSVDGSHGIQVKLHRRATAKDVICYGYSVGERVLRLNQNGVEESEF